MASTVVDGSCMSTARAREMKDPFFQPRASPAERAAIVEGWREMLCRWEWDWFATLTFRPRYAKAVGSHARLPHPEMQDKLFRVWVSKLNRALFGPRWHKKGLGVRWVRAREHHKAGGTHYHALMACQGLRDVRRLDWMDVWEQLAGYARIEEPKTQEDVSGYVAKYMAKEGELDFSPNLSFGPLFDRRAHPDAQKPSADSPEQTRGE